MIKTVLPTPLQKLRAFTLLELSVSLAIIGLMMSGVMVTMSNIVQTQAEAAAATDMREIADALKAYRIRTGHLPCPASYTTVYGSAEYGRQVNAGDCTYTVAPAGTTRVETAASNGIWVLTGAVPVRDLLMRDTFLKDQYGDRITYSVAQLLTASGTYDDNDGVITIKDSGGNDAITEGAYVLISHGKDGKGAYREGTGALKVACGATTNVDVENCDGDTVFIDAMFNDGQVVASYYDDTLIWKTKWDLIDPNAIQEEVVIGPDFPGFRVDGAIASAALGNWFTKGDVNGDGIEDIISAGQNSIILIFGSPTGILNQKSDQIANGTNGSEIVIGSGGVLASGDINGDGIDDVIIGKSGSYSTWVIFGKSTWPATATLGSLADGTSGAKLTGSGGTYFGSGVASGDINNDGIGDVIVGAEDADFGASNTGSIYVFFGKSSGWAANTNATSLNGTNGFRYDAANANSYLGRSVASGDINGDGIDDLIAGCTACNGSNIGSVQVLFGKSSAWSATMNESALNGSNGFLMNGSVASGALGFRTAVGDINGDGIDDLVASSPYASLSYVLFGKSSAWASSFSISSLNGTNGFKVWGGGYYVGWGLSAGDINDDGYDDLAVGTYDDGGYGGATYVVFGKSSGWTSSVGTVSLNGTDGFKVKTTSRYDSTGTSVVFLDVDNNEFDDLVIGGPGTDFNSLADSGSIYGIYGRTGVWQSLYGAGDLTSQ